MTFWVPTGIFEPHGLGHPGLSPAQPGGSSIHGACYHTVLDIRGGERVCKVLQSTVPEKIAARQKLGLAPKTNHQTYARSMAMSPAIKKLAVRQAATMLQAMLEKYKAPSEDHKQKEPSVKNPKAQSDSPTTPDATQDKKAGGSGAAADQPKAGSEQSDEQKAQKAHYNIKQTKRGYSVNFPDLGVSRNFSHIWLCPEALARAWGTKLQAKHMEWMSWDLAARHGDQLAAT